MGTFNIRDEGMSWLEALGEESSSFSSVGRILEYLSKGKTETEAMQNIGDAAWFVVLDFGGWDTLRKLSLDVVAGLIPEMRRDFMYKNYIEKKHKVIQEDRERWKEIVA